jgi:heptosyltransferase-2
MTSFPTPQTILVIPLRYIGDTILTVPLLRNLRQHFPHARIDVLASATAAPLLEPCPYVDQVLVEPKGTGRRLAQFKAQPYDTAFILRKSFSTAALCRLAGIQTLVGYDKQRWFEPLGYKRWGLLLDAKAPYPSLRTETPQTVSHLGLLHAFGLAASDSHLELWATPEDERFVTTLLESHGIGANAPLAVLHTVSASHGKSIEVERFLEALHRLHQQGYPMVCTGTPQDAPQYQALAEQSGLPLINLAGQTTLRQTYALYRRTHAIVTVDSSPIHLAAAAGVPNIVGVFGPTNEKQWGPHAANSQFVAVYNDLPCRPCYAKICEHNRCRTELTGMQIAEAVETVLGSS